MAKPGAKPLEANLQHHFTSVRLASYLAHSNDDPKLALDLYQWNAAASGAMWETMSHLEVALRNNVARRLQERHQNRRRTGTWLDDPARELDQTARDEIAKARERVLKKHKPMSAGQIISELGFGFWRYLFARRYTTTLWPDLATCFPNAPTRSRATIEERVHRLHLLRNRIAHHQRIWTESVADRYQDALDLFAYLDPDLATWVAGRCRVPAVLAASPIGPQAPAAASTADSTAAASNGPTR